MPWSTNFDDRSSFPTAGSLSPWNAGEYVMALPRAEKLQPKWQCAVEALILIAEGGGATMLARIA